MGTSTTTGGAPGGPLSPGAHAFAVGGIVQRYHVYGSGPVCVAHPGGPGLHWEYLRMPALEERLTMVYVEPIGSGGSGRLPSHPHGYTRDRYSRFLELLVSRLGVPKVHLLGQGHGASVAAHHALHRPERLAGVVLYEGEPAPGTSLRRTYVSGLDEDLRAESADERAGLGGPAVPVLVVTGGHDAGRGARSGRQLHELTPGSRLLVLDTGGRPGHTGERFRDAVGAFVRETAGAASDQVTPPCGPPGHGRSPAAAATPR